ncbi:MAG: hypothetical protein LUF30_11835 [Lachnospiraceae bacterium]|nr:hypothetical protein [Lachnospiraceae bacterium]
MKKWMTIFLLVFLCIPFLSGKASSDDAIIVIWDSSDNEQIYSRSDVYGSGEDSGSDTGSTGSDQAADSTDTSGSDSSAADSTDTYGSDSSAADSTDTSGSDPSTEASGDADGTVQEDTVSEESQESVQAQESAEESLSDGVPWQGLVRGVVVPIETSDSYFERTVAGSTGWNAVQVTLRSAAYTTASAVTTISAGTAFRIELENGDWWLVMLSDGTEGYVQHCYCMINLPDVLPEMEYCITNAYYSIYKSSGYWIDGVTGEKLYSAGTLESDGKVWNERLGRYEYLVPVMYSAAKKISIAQYNAYTATGGKYTLKIYDSYRPHSVTIKIASALEVLYSSNSTVRSAIDTSTESNGSSYSWGTGWFLAQSLSTHNTGSAIDVTLCVYNEDSGEYEELAMQTAMHELSTAAIKYYSSYASKTPSNYSSAMTDNAKLLDYIFVGGSYGGYTFQSTGMTTLASEWWHFQDNDTHSRVRGYTSSGCDFQVTECLPQ